MDDDAAGKWEAEGERWRTKKRVALSSLSSMSEAKKSKPWTSPASRLAIAADAPDGSAATICAAFEVEETS